MRWRRCPCGCGKLIGDDERYCRQRGERFRAFGFMDWFATATPQEQACVALFVAILNLDDRTGADA